MGQIPSGVFLLHLAHFPPIFSHMSQPPFCFPQQDLDIFFHIRISSQVAR